MYIIKSIEWDMGHRIPNHDSKCKNLHGHRYRLEATFEGKMNTAKGAPKEGMVLDFADLKSMLITEVHDVCDHGFMYSAEDKKIADFFRLNQDFKAIKVPFIPTAENIVQWIYAKLSKKLKKNHAGRLSLKRLELWETPTSRVAFENENRT